MSMGGERKSQEWQSLWKTFENIPLLLILIDEKQRILSCNNDLKKLAGYGKEDINGIYLTDLLNLSSENSRDSALPDSSILLNGVNTFEAKLYKKNRDFLPVKCSVVPIASFNSDNFEKKLFLCVIEDLTPQKRIEAQLIQAQKMEAIALLTSGIVHDFNNILTTILGYTDLILMSYEKKDVIRSYIEEIKTAGERAALLVNQLLSFTRKSNESIEIIDINGIIKDMMGMIRRLIGENIKLEIKLDDKECLLMGNPIHIQQILMNLIVNAKDAMEKGGSLIIETRNVFVDDVVEKYSRGIKPGRYVILSVVDTGVGMDKETCARIFEPFFTTKKEKKGTGLGLSTVYAIVKRYGGKIWVSSELGEGTKFEIYIPAAETMIPRPGQQEGDRIYSERLNPESDILERNINILVVEDDDLVREFIARTLINYGYNVLIAENPKEALRIADGFEGNLDLIISDVVMPEMNIDDFVEIIFEKCQGIRIIFVSGYQDEAFDSIKVHLGKPCFFLRKPLTPLDIVRKIHEALGIRFSGATFKPSKN